MVSQDSTADSADDKIEIVESTLLIVGRRSEEVFAVVDRAIVGLIIVVVVEKRRAVVAMNAP
jgi:hypothetical protein